MYHAAGTGLTIIILYTLSYFLYRNGFYTLQYHRRFWNILLAVTFLFTALAGLLLALQITYKWNIPAVRTILRWHVEIGTGLAVTGFLHLFWHFSYFTGIFKELSPKDAEAPVRAGPEKNEISLNLFVIGLISSSVQLLLLKEIMNIAGGYELITGTFLCSWLLGSAAGSSLARKSPSMDLKKINLWFSAGPLISLFLMLFLSRLFLKSGETPSFLTGAVYTFIVLLPFCLISGFAFIRLVEAGQKSGSQPGKSFSVETTGGMAAGILVSVLSSGLLNTYQSFLLIIILGFAYMVLTYHLTGNRNKFIFKAIILMMIVPVLIYSPDILFRQLLMGGITVTESTDTPYGNITRGIYNDETSTYYDQRLLSYSNDVIECEEDIHYAMLQADNPETVLLISGSIASRLNEINKYKVSKTICVERDPALAKMSETGNIGSGAVYIENADAITYLRKTNEKFDVVLLLLPPPSSLSLNRYYTKEFFTMAKEKMNKDGIFSCSPGINPNYFNNEAVNLYSSVFKSLKSVFRNVVPIAGDLIYFIASDKELTTSVCRLAQEKNIENAYVGPDYLSDDLIEQKTGEIMSVLDKSVPANTYDRPIACFYYQSLNLSKNYGAKLPSVIFLLLVFAVSLMTLRSSNGIMYFSALALAGYEITLLLVLQLAVGNMYQVTGIILAALMAGLAAGSGIDIRFLSDKGTGFKAIVLILLYIIAGLTVKEIMRSGNHVIAVFMIVIAGFFPAMVTGSIFRGLTEDRTYSKHVSGVYSADLSGSAIGFLVFAGLAIPLAGIGMSLMMLPVLAGIGFLLLLIRK
ncbi:MAG: hypothetical protein GX431_00525 [Bacteroidales bacterium]|jgi:spermidine synthase|nr:hypothetical protein [Bacteroidales bacterium]